MIDHVRFVSMHLTENLPLFRTTICPLCTSVWRFFQKGCNLAWGHFWRRISRVSLPQSLPNFHLPFKCQVESYMKKKIREIYFNFTKFLHTRKYDFGRVPKSYFSRPQIEINKKHYFFLHQNLIVLVAPSSLEKT